MDHDGCSGLICRGCLGRGNGAARNRILSKRRRIMTYRPFTALTVLTLLALFVALAPRALASTTWYVNGVNGSDTYNCLSSESGCKTIGHAISLASSGDSIKVAPATYM